MKVFFTLHLFIVYETICVYFVSSSPSGEPLTMTATFLTTAQKHQNKMRDHRNLASSRRETREVEKLRFQIDKMSIKQKIDRIKIENLNKKMDKLEQYLDILLQSNSVIKPNENDLKYLDTLLQPNSMKKNNENNLRHSNQKIKSNFQGLQDQPRTKDDEEIKKIEQKFLDKLDRKEQIFTEEIKYIREEFLKLKESCSKCGSNPPKVTSREGRDHSSLEWVMQIIPSLQNSVQDLQQSTDVVKALHNKQDVGTKLDLVIEDAKKQQKSLVQLTSLTEATSATIETLAEEFKETSSRIYEAESSLIHLKSELEDEKSAMEELLKALPDGFLSRKPNDADQKPLESPGSLKDDTTQQGMTLASEFIENRIAELEEKTSSLDFALLNMQKKVFFNSCNVSSVNDTSNKSIENCSENLSNRIEEVEFELSKMRDSSKAVLELMADFERRNGRSVKSVDDKLSIVETQIEKEIEDRSFNSMETKSEIIDTKSEIRDDYVELKNDISYLRAKISSFEDSINRSKQSSIDSNEIFQSKINENCLNIIRHENEFRDQNLSQIEKRLKTVEKLASKNSKFLHKRKRHKHGLNYN